MVLGRLSGDMGWGGGDDERGREGRTVGGGEERDLVNYADINESAVGVRIPWITSFMCIGYPVVLILFRSKATITYLSDVRLSVRHDSFKQAVYCICNLLLILLVVSPLA